MSITLTCDCIKQNIQQKSDQNIFNEYLLNTTSIDGIITPRVPSNLIYHKENCPINDILKNYFTAANELFYQSTKQKNTLFENTKNELNVLLNKGILYNGNIREYVTDTTYLVCTVLLNDLNRHFDNYKRMTMKLVDKLELDISKITTDKVNASTIKNVKENIQQIMLKNLKKISDRWIVVHDQIIIAFYNGDMDATTFYMQTANTSLAGLKLAIAKSVMIAKRLERNVELDFQYAENDITHILHGAEQEILNVVQSICVDLM